MNFDPQDVKRESGVYCIVCYPTGDMYIGCTSNLTNRLRQHIFEIRQSFESKYRIIRALGPGNCHFIVIATGVTKKELRAIEDDMIVKLMPSLNRVMPHRGMLYKLNPEQYERYNQKAVKDFMLMKRRQYAAAISKKL